jgi:N-acetylglutamate synthase-like GNAT family acetyltransferase
MELGSTYQWTQGKYRISADPDAVDFDTVFDFLSRAPWASGLSREALGRALRNSLCFSLLEETRQIGVARVISDFSTYAYLCDVYIVDQQRGRGLGSWLVRCVLSHPDISCLKRIALITHDAQDFYLDLGFEFASHPNHYMERLLRPNESSSCEK